MKNPSYPKPTAEMKEAAKNVAWCMAELKVIRPKVEAIQNDILAEVNPVDENGQPVTWFNLYLCDDSVSDKCFDLSTERTRAAGLNAPEGCCPLLVAENNLRKANRVMNELALALMPEDKRIDLDSIWDMDVLKKLTDLNLKYIISHTWPTPTNLRKPC